MSRRLEHVRVHVLVDDTACREVVVNRLIGSGATVSSCSTVQVLEWIAAQPLAQIDVVVIDPCASGGSGLAAAVALQVSSSTSCPWIAITDRDDPLRRHVARVTGEFAEVEPRHGLDRLVDAVAQCVATRRASPSTRAGTSSATPWPELRPEDARVASLLIQGESNKGIAAALGWELGSVSHAIRRLMDLTNVVPRKRSALGRELRRRAQTEVH